MRVKSQQTAIQVSVENSVTLNKKLFIFSQIGFIIKCFLYRSDIATARGCQCPKNRQLLSIE